MLNARIAQSLAQALVLAVPLGEAHSQYASCLKDMLYQLPDLSQSDWYVINELLDDPHRQEHATEVWKRLKMTLAMPEARSEAIYALERVFNFLPALAFGEMEATALVDIAREGTPEEAAAAFGAIVTDALNLCLSAMEDTPVAVEDLQQMVIARTESWRSGKLNLQMPDRELHKLCLEAIVLARMAFADAKVDDAERHFSESFLCQRWELTVAQADFVLEMSLADDEQEIDFLRVCRWYFELTDELERQDFLELLFQLATVDNDLSEPEVNELMNIAANLRIDQEDFHALFLRYGGVERLSEESAQSPFA